MIKLLWKKLQDNAIIPTKTIENIGYDIYHTYTEPFVIEPHETVMVPTGLAVAIVTSNTTDGQVEGTNNYALIAKDRGSTGSIGLHTYCGVIDAGYRGEIFIALHNSNDVPIDFCDVQKSKKCYDDLGELECIAYPLTKAIAQLILVDSYNVESEEVKDDELWISLCNTKRGDGKLGSSQK